MIETLSVALGALIALAGGVVTQWMMIKAASKQAEEDQHLRRFEIFASLRATQFATLLVLADDRARDLDSLRYLPHGDVRQRLEEDADQWWREWTLAATQVQLLAPSLAPLVDELRASISDREEGFLLQGETEPSADHAPLFDQIAQLTAALQGDLDPSRDAPSEKRKGS